MNVRTQADTTAFPEVFVVGTGRCGSTLISQMLKSHPDILSVSELFMELASRAFNDARPSGRQFWRLLSRASPSVRRVLNPRWCPDEFLYQFGPGAAFGPHNLPPISYITLPHLTCDPDRLYFEIQPIIEGAPQGALADQYRLLFQFLCRRLGKKMWVERSGGSLVYLPALVKHFPNAKYIHIFRDGRDVALSIAKHAPMRLLANNWHRAKRFGIDLFRPPLQLGESRILATLEHIAAPFASSERMLEKDLPLEQIGAYWSHMITVGHETLMRIPPAQRYDLRYEDLVDNPAEEFRKVMEFIDPRLCNEDWLSAVCTLPQQSGPRHGGLSQSRWPSLTRSCMPGLQILGYPVA